MSIDIDYTNRQVVPRLLPTRTSNLLSLNISSSQTHLFALNPHELHNLQKLRNEWIVEKSIILAIQILSYEVIHDELAIDNGVLEYVKDRKNQLNIVEKEIFTLACIKGLQINSTESCCDDTININQTIKNLKEENKLNNLNPFQWCDLGYYYTIQGQKQKARRAFLIAINLNDSNRFVVRSVARFLLHIGEIEFAHQILNKSPRIKSDPGILSAEIAFSEIMGRKSKLINYGTLMVNDMNVSVEEKNELIAQLASIEFSYGKSSRGKSLVEKCLVSPNENSLAQFEFLTKNFRIDHDFDAKYYSVMCQYEALARSHFANSDFLKALNNSKLWFDFQPFSNKPAIFSSYIAAAVLSDYNQAITIAKNALKISPDSSALKNNLAYSYARNNQTNQAIKTLESINLSRLEPYESAVISATIGFISFKKGDIESAKKGYDGAIKYFRTVNNQEALARALYNYSLVMKNIDRDESSKLVKEASELSEKNRIVELIYIIKKET